MAKIIVLGAGMVGRAIAVDLAERHDVSSADVNEDALRTLEEHPGIATTSLDVTDSKRLESALAGFDLVISAVPGSLGFAALRTAIEAGKHVVDIAFSPEDTLELDPLAKKRGVTALVDMGVAPGMDHLFLGHHDATMQVSSFECLVGGLPQKRTWPFDYKAPFSPVDVIEEYTRPARYVENGHLVTRPALSDPELVHFDEIGTLEAFNTDGLRSLLTTFSHVPNMKEKTLRYPGHIRLIQALQESGFFSRERIAVAGAEVSPLEFTSRILTDAWVSAPDEREFTIMRVTIEGEQGGDKKCHVYELYDAYDPETRTSSMARTTGYTCTGAAQVLLEGLFTDAGVFPAESVGRHERCFERMLAYLTDRGVVCRRSERSV
jgi:saccharopine dehydrogenase-like NADP-dependent oxidoreductase